MAIKLDKRIHSDEAQKKKPGSEVVVAGFAADLKVMGKLAFINLRDVEGHIQLVSLDKKIINEINKLTRESVIAVQGKIKKSKLKTGGNEIEIKNLEVLSKAETPLPIDISGKITTDLSKRLDWRCLDLRNPKVQAIFEIQSKLMDGAFEWLEKNNFTFLSTPCLMGAPSESGAELFAVPYFNKKAFLRQDPQLHRQLAIASGFEKIVDMGPSWRAELSHTIRHLCEHRGIAVELAFIKDETDTMRIEEQLIIAALKKVKKDCQKELKLLGKTIEIPKIPFPELRFPEIYKILEKLGKKTKFGEDIDDESEKILAQYVKKKYNHDFYFINRFPFKAKPFYVMRVDKEPKWARSVDLIYRGVEQSSGGQREHRYDNLMQNVKEKNIKSVEWFTKFFAYGAPSHGGFNLGVERLTMQLLELSNIREATLFPRDPERLAP